MPTLKMIENAVRVLTTNNSRFCTIDVIRYLQGNYLCDLETPANRSSNAQIGRMIAQLKIRKLRQRAVRDDGGHRSKATEWIR